MAETAILRARIDPRRKTAAEAVLKKLGVTPTQAINMLYAQIVRRKAIPFPVSIDDDTDILPPLAHVAEVWGRLDDDDYSQLAKQ